MRPLVLFLFILLNCSSASAQLLYYYDEFSGGVTAGGYAPDYAASGTGTITLHFPAGATIRRAFLFAGDHDSQSPLTITLNGIPFTFSDLTRVTPGFFSYYGRPAFVHAIDVASAIDPAGAGQTIVVPNQSAANKRFTDFYLVVSYDVPGYKLSRVSMFLDTISFDTAMALHIPIAPHSRSSGDLAFGLYTGYICNALDAEDIYYNAAKLGTIYGQETNSGTCGGPYANFFYENAVLRGLGDDNADLRMIGADALSNIRTLVKPKDTAADLLFVHEQNRNDNSIWGVIIVDGDTGCDAMGSLATYPPSIGFKSLTVCSGPDSVSGFITNNGCSSLMISSAIAFDQDYSATGLNGRLLLPRDTARFTVYITPHSRGAQKGTISIIAHPPGDTESVQKQQIAIDGFVGDGIRTLTPHPDSIDFGIASRCATFDTTIVISNTGCDSLRIDTAYLSGSGFAIGGLKLPVFIAADDSIRITLRSLIDSSGKNPSAAATFILSSNAGNTVAPISIRRGYRTNPQYKLFLDPPQQSGPAGGIVEFILRTDADMTGVTTIDLDLTTSTELLTFIKSPQLNPFSFSGGHLHIIGSPQIVTMNGSIDTLRFAVRLAKDSIEDLVLSHIRINSNDSTISPCAAITSTPGATFLYHYLCGDHTIQRSMNGILPLTILSISPNPATGEMNVRLRSAEDADISAVISNALGMPCLRRTFSVSGADVTERFDISSLPSGAYTIELTGDGGTSISHFMKIQ